MQSFNTEHDWESAPDDRLYTIGGLDGTPLAILSPRARYELIRRGELATVEIGARKYISRRAIREFLANRESRPLENSTNEERQPLPRPTLGGAVDVADDAAE